ncbi:hypothetical protein JGS22_015535 [Streptomyces sp. P38-E01]|uniref:Transcriptional regulator, AbiEi antitoxin, Type IV TA system n=1 Tax=Streptomyces tardus TaxID=2780544 RepID=A0A949N9K5_9ACTN|nr:hypothetical protein [Streptomyces tardus]MBU7598983.1 hypothetical protein [Streptomyces tardus]
MAHETPLPPRSANRPRNDDTTVVTAAVLRAQGVSAAAVRDLCRTGGPWQAPLPGVYLLHPDEPTEQERLRAVLLYAEGDGSRVPEQGGRPVLSGLAALALYGFRSAPPIAALERIEVLVPRSRRARSSGWARIVHVPRLPPAQEVEGLPLAPVARALADAVAGLTEPAEVHRLLAEAVRARHCESAEIVRELRRGRLLARPQVVDAVDTLLAEGRAVAESRLYALVREGALPQPCWNVELRQPGGPSLGAFDAYWPEHRVAVELDACGPARDRAGSTLWPPRTRQRTTASELGVTVLGLTPDRLREEPRQLAAVLRTALMTAHERGSAAEVLVLPR